MEADAGDGEKQDVIVLHHVLRVMEKRGAEKQREGAGNSFVDGKSEKSEQAVAHQHGKNADQNVGAGADDDVADAGIRVVVFIENGQLGDVGANDVGWEEEQRLADASTMDDAVRKYLNVTSYYGQQVEMDTQARLLLPQILRNAAKLDGEVTVFGMRTYLEVHNREIFEQNLAASQLTAEDRKAMAEILRPKS